MASQMEHGRNKVKKPFTSKQEKLLLQIEFEKEILITKLLMTLAEGVDETIRYKAWEDLSNFQIHKELPVKGYVIIIPYPEV